MRVRLSALREFLQEHCESVLVEGRVEDAREKYPEMPDEDFDYLRANQPAGSNNKYLLWACARADELMEDDPDRTALDIVVQAIRLFDGNKQRLEKKDLYQYKTTSEIEDAIEKLGGPSKNQKAQQARADTDVIHNDDQFMVLRPHTTEASCKYGIGTKWCIAATASRNYYNQYSEGNNKFYFVIDKTAAAATNNSKFAIVILDAVKEDTSRIQAFNAADRQVGLQTVVRHVGEKWPEIWNKIKQHVAKYADTREVEDARKAVEEHVKSLIKGEKVSNEGLKKISKDSTPTTQVVNALIKAMREYSGPLDYTDPRSEIISNLSKKAGQLTPEGAMALLEFIPTTKPANGGYWSSYYHINDIVKNAPLGPDNFRKLAAEGNDEVLRNVVSNPNAPADILQTLAGRLNDLQNRDLKSTIYRQLIKTGTITAEQMRDAVSPQYYLRHDLFHYPELMQNLSPELMRLIPVQNGEEIKKLLTLPNVPSDLAVDLITNNWKLFKKSELYELLKTITLPVEMIERLWDGKDQHMRISLLQNPSVGETNIVKFAQSRNSAYRFAIAHNPSTTPEILQTMAGDESASTRSAVAAHPNTPPETLRVLASDEATIVRASIASNGSTPVNILNALRKDGDSFIRRSAAKTLKAKTATESIIREMMSMRSLLREELEDEDAKDVMNPRWQDIPNGDIGLAEFVAVYLLQNNGSASREEISDAFQMWRGVAGAKQLWQTDRHSNEIIRGISASGKGWYWSPPGVNKGALFRLTPAGASAAMTVLDKYRNRIDNARHRVTSATAKPGKTYYTSQRVSAVDITDYANGELSVERLEVDANGNLSRRGGEVHKVSSSGGGGYRRGRRGRRYYNQGTRSGKFFKYVSPAGATSYFKTEGDLNYVELQTNTPVQYVKPFIGYSRSDGGDAEENLAVVKRDGRTLLVKFPLWAQEHGATPTDNEPNVAPPVKKSPPPRELTGAPAPERAPREPNAAAPAGPRGPKTSYKIYGRHRGSPAHTRLKGQAYVAPADTQFRNGEQAGLTVGDDGKLKVKKVDSDHTQSWEPSEG